MKLRKGEWVRVGAGRGIPVRYQNRFGIATGTTQTKSGVTRVGVSFPGRRVNPLFVAANRISLD